MPGSIPSCDWILMRDLQEIQPTTVFEVGVGEGRISKIIKSVAPQSQITGFEIFAKYLEDYQHQLAGLHTQIIVADFHAWIQQHIDWQVDCVVMCDVLEHLPISKVYDVLDMCQQRCKWMLIKTPLKLRQNTVCNNIKEGHISEVTLQKLMSYDIRKYICEDLGAWSMAYYLIKGWL